MSCLFTFYKKNDTGFHCINAFPPVFILVYKILFLNFIHFPVRLDFNNGIIQQGFQRDLAFIIIQRIWLIY